MEDVAPNLENILDKVETILVKYAKLKAENQQLRQDISGMQEASQKNEAIIKEMDHKIAVLKTVKQMPVDGQDRSEVRNKVNEFIKEIDRCIALLSN